MIHSPGIKELILLMYSFQVILLQWILQKKYEKFRKQDYYSSVRNVVYLTVLIIQISKQVGVWRHWWSSVFPICSEAWYCFNSVLEWEIVLNKHKIIHETFYYSKSIESFLNLFQIFLIFLILFAPYHSGHLKASIYSNK